METVWVRFWQKRVPKILLLALLSAVTIAPAVQAATGVTLNNGQILALALLGITTISLSIYLFVVIFQPEKF